MKALTYTTLAATVLAFASVSVAANDSGDSMDGMESMDADNPKPMTLAEWEYSSIYNLGIRAQYLLGEEVFGAKGNEVGNIENVIIASHEIAAVLVELGGFWELNDTHIAVPWDEVELTPDGIKIPVTKETVDDYKLFAENSFVTVESLRQTQSTQVDESFATGSETWKVTTLLNDYVVLESGAGYGYIAGMIFSKDGEIQAILVQPTVEGYGDGMYAYPFYAVGYEPYASIYTLPYESEEMVVMEPFQYTKLEGYWSDSRSKSTE